MQVRRGQGGQQQEAEEGGYVLKHVLGSTGEEVRRSGLREAHFGRLLNQRGREQVRIGRGGLGGQTAGLLAARGAMLLGRAMPAICSS